MILRLLITVLCVVALLFSAKSVSRTLVLVSIDGFRWEHLDWPQAHQLDVYPVTAGLLNLTTPDNIGSDGGKLRAALREP